MSNPQNQIYREALDIFKTGDKEKAKQFIRERFGEDVDLNIVKCEACGEVIALCSNLLATGLTGGDKQVNLRVYKHIQAHPDHMNCINGYSHGVALPLGQTLGMSLESTGKRFGLSFDAALRTRIEHLEKQLNQIS